MTRITLERPNVAGTVKDDGPVKVPKVWYNRTILKIFSVFLILVILASIVVGILCITGKFNAYNKDTNQVVSFLAKGIKEENITLIPVTRRVRSVDIDDNSTDTSAVSSLIPTATANISSTPKETNSTLVEATNTSVEAEPLPESRSYGERGYKYVYAVDVDENNIAPKYADMEKKLFTPWSEWAKQCGNGECEEGEWCRTCPQDCNCTVDCGNGICNDGENGQTCPEDCPYHIAACGNGICEDNGEDWTWSYENSINCPQDCPNNDTCGNDKCELSESCFLCPQDCGKCEPICGDSSCNGDETCSSCIRDCGVCSTKDDDGHCQWPRESLDSVDCQTKRMENNITFEGVIYATIDNAEIPSGLSYNNKDCSDWWIEVPAGWVIAPFDKRSERLLQSGNVSFTTGCAVFDEDVTRPANPDSDPGDCEGMPILKTIENGIEKVRVSEHVCPSRIIIAHIRSLLDKNENLKECSIACEDHGGCNPFTGQCVCGGRWTGPDCERIIGDTQIPQSTNTWYQPPRGIPWQWQLQNEIVIDESLNIPLYDIDFDMSIKTFERLHKKDKKVMCYFSAGSWEKFRQDEDLFPREGFGGILKFGAGDYFPGEAWLDLRRMDLYLEIMLNRIDAAKKRGCDAIEFDNPDGIIHETNFKKKGKFILNTQLVYNKWLVAQTHARGMAVALKNSNEFASYLYKTYDMVVNEECFINSNCANYWPFLNDNKPVLNAEYFTARCLYCDQANQMEISTIKKVPDLDACRVDCKTTWKTKPCEKAKYPLHYPEGNWCKAVKNNLKDECPSKRFSDCNPMRPY